MSSTTPFRTKITAVRFKSGGELRVMASNSEAASREVESWMKSTVQDHIQDAKDRMAGAVIVSWHADGSISASYTHVHTSPYTGSALPHLVAEGVRKVQLKSMINRAFRGGD